MLIVLRESALPLWERVAALRPRGFPVPLDLFPFTRQELADRRGSPMAAALDRSTWRYRR